MADYSDFIVLVVDDTEANVDILVETLGKEYEMCVALNGEDALEQVQTEKPDLILLDIMMPGMDGYEVCKRLKQDPETRDIPIIFLTAMAEEQDEAKGLSLGAVDYVIKPFSSNLVHARINNQLELKRHRDQLEVQIKERTRAEQRLKEALKVITSSIQYASRIQRSILPEESLLQTVFKDYFVLWEPRDVVGGDIYWCDEWGDGVLFVLCDCTGHGVPGAFVSLIAIGALERAKTTVNPGDVGGLLTRMHQLVQQTLGQETKSGDSDDGLELGAFWVAPDWKQMIFSGARFDLFITEDHSIRRIKGNRKGMGYRRIPPAQEYEDHTVTLLPGLRFYMISDGFTDQVGGSKRLMFGVKRFQNLLISLQDLSLVEQKERIRQALIEYQGSENRRDDITVVGFKL